MQPISSAWRVGAKDLEGRPAQHGSAGRGIVFLDEGVMF